MFILAQMAVTLTALPEAPKTGIEKIDGLLQTLYGILALLGVLGTVVASLRARFESAKKSKLGQIAVGLWTSIQTMISGIEEAATVEIVDVLIEEGVEASQAQIIARKIHTRLTDRLKQKAKDVGTERIMKPIVTLVKTTQGEIKVPSPEELVKADEASKEPKEMIK